MTADFVHCDAFEFMRTKRGVGPVVTSLPTATELDMTPDQWAVWRVHTLSAVAECVDGRWPAVFVQTDRLADGRTYSWPISIGCALPIIWHKVALRRDPGVVDLYRPTYRHVMAAGYGRPGRRTADVWYDGKVRWANGVGERTAWLVAVWLAETCRLPNGEAATVLNPFCGVGTFVHAAHAAGLKAVGCDNNPDRIRQARESS